MRIAIVDDEKNWQAIVEAWIRKFPWNVEIEVDVFANGEDFCDAGEYDVVFMDIEMPGMGGFEAAKICKEKSKETIMVFLTVNTELSRQGYLVNAFRYIDKQYFESEIEEALRAILDLCNKNHVLKFHMLRTGDYEIPLEDILYMETDRRNVVIHTMKQAATSNRKIEELEEELKDYWFFRSHKSYLVNLVNIHEVGKKDIKFANGEIAMLSVRRRSEFKHRYMEYKFRYANS